MCIKKFVKLIFKKKTLLDDYYADDEDQHDSTTTTSVIESKSRILEPNSELRQADLIIPGWKVGLHFA